jgi:transglutaminase-like putative cysteine protease
MGPERLTYSVSHHTTLRYSEPVVPSFNEARMRPRARGSQKTVAFALITSPPVVPRSRVDYFGNYVHRVDIGVPHEALEIAVEAVVESVVATTSLNAQPWDQDVLDGDPRLEFALPSPRVPLGGEPAELGKEWTGGDPSIDALLACAERIRATFRYLPGATTVDSSIEELLRGGAGVCQDFTHLFLAVARSAGWPSRYVSGYLGPTADGETVHGASHAWAEVCGADGRWVGIDPTHGGPTGPEHLRLAVGRDYGDVAPHRGLFFGSATASPPEVFVRVSRMPAAAAFAVERTSDMQWQQQLQQQQSTLRSCSRPA